MATSRRVVQIREEDYNVLNKLRREFGLPIIKIQEFLLFEEYPRMRKCLETYKKGRRGRNPKR